MKNLFYLLCCTIFLFTACSQGTESEKPSKSDKSTPGANFVKGDTQEGALIDWIDITELEKKMKKKPKKVMVDLYTSWCGWCKRMDKATFQHPEIASYVNDNFYAVKFNAETENDINFKGQTYKWVPGRRRGTNQLTYKLVLGDNPNGRVGYPTIAFLDEKMDRIDAFPGYKDANKFDGLMRFIDGEHYKSQKLSEFQQSYESPIPAAPSFNKKSPQKVNIQKRLKELQQQQQQQLNEAKKKSTSNP